ncbi:hypothetical protein WNY37_05495 [Henriciella sp. AS95]|uniref:hypothetical protein n=1 Tax=Henriciella sp. AS95 TaxID=3135782 RepID=UPI00318145E3
MVKPTNQLCDTAQMEAQFKIADRAAQRAGVHMTRIRRHVYRVLLETDAPLNAYDLAERLTGIACP